MRAAQIPDSDHQGGHLVVHHDKTLRHVVLADGAKDEPSARLRPQVPVAGGSDAVGAVALHAVLGAHAKPGLADEAKHDGEDALAQEALAVDVDADPAAKGGQALAEALHALELPFSRRAAQAGLYAY